MTGPYIHTDFLNLIFSMWAFLSYFMIAEREEGSMKSFLKLNIFILMINCAFMLAFFVIGNMGPRFVMG